ncbi:MAG: lipoyl protein ligase domain-containing protein [Verrucomicrobiota bacterium]
MSAIALRVLPPAVDTAPDNMARDAALLAWAGAADCAALRVYGWSEPAMTFGYSQRWSEVQAQAPTPAASLRLVRRETGGGLVDHREDLTYACALPPVHPAAREAPRTLYCRLHEALADALRGLGVPCELAPCPVRGALSPVAQGPAVCFARAEPSDVIAPSGAKLAGAALRRNATGLLVQGSLDRRRLPARLSCEALLEAFGEALARHFSLARPDLAREDEVLPHPAAVARFASRAWNERR